MKKRLIIYRRILDILQNFRLVLLFISFFILFGALGITIVNTYEQTQQKDKQLAVLQADVQNERDKYQSLLQQKQYYSSDAYIEKEARNLLGLSYPNEQIYVLPSNNSKANNVILPAPTSVIPQANKTADNIQKWMDIIFAR